MIVLSTILEGNNTSDVNLSIHQECTYTDYSFFRRYDKLFTDDIWSEKIQYFYKIYNISPNILNKKINKIYIKYKRFGYGDKNSKIDLNIVPSYYIPNSEPFVYSNLFNQLSAEKFKYRLEKYNNAYKKLYSWQGYIKNNILSFAGGLYEKAYHGEDVLESNSKLIIKYIDETKTIPIYNTKIYNLQVDGDQLYDNYHKCDKILNNGRQRRFYKDIMQMFLTILIILLIVFILYKLVKYLKPKIIKYNDNRRINNIVKEKTIKIQAEKIFKQEENQTSLKEEIIHLQNIINKAIENNEQNTVKELLIILNRKKQTLNTNNKGESDD